MFIEMEEERVFAEVQREMDSQDKKWGEQNHDPLKWGAILGEETGEVHKAILENDPGYRFELIQVAAVAMQAVKSYDRSKGA